MNQAPTIPHELLALPRSWSEARDKSEKWYCTGEPCKDCDQVDNRLYPGGGCRTCMNAKNREKGKEKRDAARAAKEEARAAAEAAKAAARQARIDMQGLEAVEAEEQAERLAAEQALKDAATASRRAWRQKRMRDKGTEPTHAEERAEQRDWYARTRDVRLAKRRERTARGVAGYRMTRLRTPPWLADNEHVEIVKIYAQRGEKEEVDHIVPIDSHPDLAGIHVPWNLRVITRPENRRRSKGRADEFVCTDDEAADYVARGMAVWKKDIGADGVIDWALYPRPGEPAVMD